MTEWIKCSERMPPLDIKSSHESIRCLVADSSGDIFVGFYCIKTKEWHEHYIDDENIGFVTHWMPLPEGR